MTVERTPRRHPELPRRQHQSSRRVGKYATGQSYLIKMGRLKKGWTLTAFATQMGLSWSYLSDVERGKRILTNPETIAKAAALLELDPDEFYYTVNRVPPDIVAWLSVNHRITKNLRVMKRKMGEGGG